MKFHPYLAILLATIVKSTMAISETTDIEPVEPVSVDLNAAEQHYRLTRAMGISVKHYGVDEHGSGVGKRDRLTCTTDCGGPPVKSCNALLENLAQRPPDEKICADHNTQVFVDYDCGFSYTGPQNNKVNCISQKNFFKYFHLNQ